MIIQAGLGELDFMDSVDVEDVFEVNEMILGLFADRNVAPLNSFAEGFNDVAFTIKEDSDVIPACEFLVRTRITNFFAKANHAAGPAGTVSEDEISGKRIVHLFTREEGFSQSRIERDRARIAT